MMSKASASLFHGPMMTMGGQQQLGAAERLRVYRRCFHDLDEQLMQLQASGGIQDLDLRKMQAELRSLEDLIVIFTDLNSALKAKQSCNGRTRPFLSDGSLISQCFISLDCVCGGAYLCCN